MTSDTLLHSAVSRAITSDPLADLVQDVTVETAWDENDDEFLRVLLVLNQHGMDDDADLERLLNSIEDAVAEIDKRYASVRFLDAG
jgi:hypothetical protein